MWNGVEFAAGDRVLALFVPEAPQVRALAAQAPQGLVIFMGPDDAVRAARKASSEVDNVMFVPAEDGTLPWPGGFFTVALHAGTLDERLASELRRVLVADGRVCPLGDAV